MLGSRGKTLRTFALGVFIAASAAIWLVATTAGAQTPTPTEGPTPTPDASPTPTPYAGPTSTITVRFVRGGQPVSLSFLSFPGGVFADGARCPYITTEAFNVSQFVTRWPLTDGPPECQKGPPTTLRFEFGLLAIEFLWTGTDVLMDIEVGGASAAPPQLPSTGGPIHGQGTPLARELGLLGGACAAMVVAVAIIGRKRGAG